MPHGQREPDRGPDDELRAWWPGPLVAAAASAVAFLAGAVVVHLAAGEPPWEHGGLIAGGSTAVLVAGFAGAALLQRRLLARVRSRMADREARVRRLELLTRHANDVILLADDAQRIVDVNDRAVELLGYARAELVGMPARELRDPATLGDFEARTREELERGGALFETRYRRKDGSTFPVEVSIHSGEVDGLRYFQAVIRDVTERRRAEEALRESEARFRTLVEQAGAGILLVSPDGRIRETNRALRELVGHGEEELRGLPVAALGHPEQRERSRQAFAELVSGAVRALAEPRVFLRKDGLPVEVFLRASAVRDEAGRVRYAVGIVEDLTEKRRLESQLRLADRMASVGTLAAGVAHEINNPLAYVIANLDFALAELAGEAAPGAGSTELREALAEARGGAVRVREIVRDLKALSRAGDEGKDLVDVRRTVQGAVSLAQGEIRHRARMALDLAEVPPVVGSEHRLGQVFLNLLINAAQAIPEGEVDRHLVQAATSVAPDGRVAVEVTDTGVGIAAEVLPRIFDPFFTTKPVGVGTGLGLSIAHGIVSEMGGELRVQSEPGRGSIFTVLLPPAVRDPAEAAPPSPDPAPPRPAAPAGRVLVVDDEPLVGRAVTRILSREWEVVSVTSAAEAEARLAAEPFDVVLCDLMMPQVTGMELFDRLAASRPEVAARVVFLTGGAFTEAARSFLERVPNPRVEKPFEPGVLRGAVAGAAGR